MKTLNVPLAMVGFAGISQYVGNEYCMWISLDKTLLIGGNMPDMQMPDFSQYGSHVNDGVEWKKITLNDFVVGLFLRESLSNIIK